jgi:hypothetical protein
VYHARRAWVTDAAAISPEDPGAARLPIVPACEHVGSVRIPRRVFRWRRGLVSGATPRANWLPHRSLADAKLGGNRFHRTTWLVQVNSLLRARISLEAMGGNGPRNLYSWVGTPFFHGGKGSFLGVCFPAAFAGLLLSSPDKHTSGASAAPLLTGSYTHGNGRPPESLAERRLRKRWRTPCLGRGLHA